MYCSLKEQGRAASGYYADCPVYFSMSPAELSLLQTLRHVVGSYCRGRFFDWSLLEDAGQRGIQGSENCFCWRSALPALGLVGSTPWINLFFVIPLINLCAWRLNILWVKLVAWLDGVMEKMRIFALNYNCIEKSAARMQKAKLS